ncbi:MAG TPA: class I SAM-dependent methyltransferase [Opitutaceae bacterium]|nr:class I SAM-dependent methyltransferase [Opitutaceae bacterium]
MAAKVEPISGAIVRADFNAVEAVLHYTRAAHRLGLWQSERQLIERFFPDKAAPLLEAGCGAGRATLGLWELGYTNLTAFDFAEELVEQARDLAAQRGATGIRFLHADATRRALRCALAHPVSDLRSPVSGFSGALFLFNGLMQIPTRRARRAALRNLAAVLAPGAPFLFTTHDRDEPDELHLWRAEAKRWAAGKQDPRLHEYGDRYFEHEHGRTFMHLPTRDEMLRELGATGWIHEYDAMRADLARESHAVKDFSDNCRFWLVRTPAR